MTEIALSDVVVKRQDMGCVLEFSVLELSRHEPETLPVMSVHFSAPSFPLVGPRCQEGGRKS